MASCNHHDRLGVLAASVSLSVLVLACSASGAASTGALGAGSQNASGGASAGDGTVGTGGNSGAGGTSVTATGGNSAATTGGSSAIPTGGKTGTGGSSAIATGGRTGTGGSSVQSSSSCTTANEAAFSFFLISNSALIRESGNADGFGGNLGGLAGADAICQRVAEYVSPCQSSKVWHAFLSTTTVNAIDRLGTGPWHDRNGRLFANSLSELLNDRPTTADPNIKNDFPNEDGVANSDPNNTGRAQAVDNHEILTGSGTDGKVYAQTTTPGMSGSATSCGDGTWTVAAATCWDWTSSDGKGCPRVGHSWPNQMSGVNWISVWNEGGCAPGGNLTSTVAGGGLDGTRRVGSAGGYGGFYCFAVTP